MIVKYAFVFKLPPRVVAVREYVNTYPYVNLGRFYTESCPVSYIFVLKCEVFNVLDIATLLESVFY